MYPETHQEVSPPPDRLQALGCPFLLLGSTAVKDIKLHGIQPEQAQVHCPQNPADRKKQHDEDGQTPGWDVVSGQTLVGINSQSVRARRCPFSPFQQTQVVVSLLAARDAPLSDLHRYHPAVILILGELTRHLESGLVAVGRLLARVRRIPNSPGRPASCPCERHPRPASIQISPEETKLERGSYWRRDDPTLHAHQTRRVFQSQPQDLRGFLAAGTVPDPAEQQYHQQEP